MSDARLQFIDSLNGIRDAVQFGDVSAGAGSSPLRPGVLVLRRGILITALITLETFVRDRTIEILEELRKWPAGFADFPQNFRDEAILHSLPHLHRYGTMLKRQDDDYENEISIELQKISSINGPNIDFTKFISGDHTGNISDSSLKRLLAIFQIKDCWNSIRVFCQDIYLGTPSIQEVVRNIVRKRHRSAHAARYIPTAADISELHSNVFRIGICFDASMTSSIKLSLSDWQKWSNGEFSWRENIDLYFLEPIGADYRLIRHGRMRALKRFKESNQGFKLISSPQVGKASVVVELERDRTPKSWRIF